MILEAALMSISPTAKANWNTARLTHSGFTAQLKNKLLFKPSRDWNFWLSSVRTDTIADFFSIELSLHILKSFGVCDMNSNFLFVF